MCEKITFLILGTHDDRLEEGEGCGDKHDTDDAREEQRDRNVKRILRPCAGGCEEGRPARPDVRTECKRRAGVGTKQ